MLFKIKFWLALIYFFTVNFNSTLLSLKRQDRKERPVLIELEEDDVNLSLSEILSKAELEQDVFFTRKGVEIKFFENDYNLVLAKGQKEKSKNNYVKFDKYLLYRPTKVNSETENFCILSNNPRRIFLSQVKVYLDLYHFQERVLGVFNKDLLRI